MARLGTTHRADTIRAVRPAGVKTLKLEALGLHGITLQFRLNTGFGTAWKLVLPAAA